MSNTRKSIRKITRTLTSLDGTESFAGQDNDGDFQATLKNLILNIEHPVGSFYTQYPDAESNDAATAFPSAYTPANLWGGTWELQFDDEGICFYTEPNVADSEQIRSNGLQEDQMQGWQLGSTADATGSRNYFAGASNRDIQTSGSAQANESLIRITTGSQGVEYMLKAVSDGTNGTPRTGSTTKGRNRLVRIWKRTA
jgi:hypothetical protein